MRRVLKDRVVPELRRRGFRGSFPTFTRPRGAGEDGISFQFSQWGGAFYVNWTGPEAINRLGARPPRRDHAFEYDTTRSVEANEPVFQQRASEVLQFLDEQAEAHWRVSPSWPSSAAG